MSRKSSCSRRTVVAAALGAASLTVAAAPLVVGSRAQREMTIHRVTELGLEVWVENQPPWDAQVMKAATLTQFVAQSPADYYPPAVMTYIAVPGAAVDDVALLGVATTAIRRAAENYRVAGPTRVQIKPRPAQHGSLSGFEADFEGWANGESVDVKVFVGHEPGRFPVALQAYTLRGKLPQLSEPIRRAWGRVKYLR